MNSELEKNFKEVEKNFSELHSISNYRKKSFLNFQKKGFPTRELEDWKFFDFKRIINKKFNKLNINCSKDNINYKNKQLPYFANGWEELFYKSNNIDKAIHFIYKRIQPNFIEMLMKLQILLLELAPVQFLSVNHLF